MIVCGIDPSLTSAGVAILHDGKPIHTSHHGYNGHNGATYQTRSRRVRWTAGQVLTALREHCCNHPDLVVIEGPAYSRNTGSAFDRAGLWHGIYAALDAKNIPIAVSAPGSASLWATGRGRASKSDIIATVHDWWWTQPRLDSITDDEADALVLATIGAFHLGDPMPFDVKPRHTTGLEKVQWPA